MTQTPDTSPEAVERLMDRVTTLVTEQGSVWVLAEDYLELESRLAEAEAERDAAKQEGVKLGVKWAAGL
jgi:hypothetical protein